MPTYRYGSARYGELAYGGLSPATVIPTRNTSGITFFASNDRYQVIVCAYGGSLYVAPEFRYWYSAPPSWAEELNNDAFIPPYYSADELGSIPTGSLETPFRRVKSPQEMIVEDVVVEFICRPSALTSETLPSTDTCSFTVQVEAQGVPGYDKTVSDGMTGMLSSDAKSFSEVVTSKSSQIWPNIRTEVFQCRISQRVRAARVVISNIQLVEILAVQLRGKTSIPAR